MQMLNWICEPKHRLTAPSVCPQHQGGGHHPTDRGGCPEGRVLYP